MLDNQIEYWRDVRDSLLYTRPSIPFRIEDIFFRNQTLLQKWCKVELTPEQVFDANKEHERFWLQSQYEQRDWRISRTHPIFYSWGNDVQPMFESQMRELTIRRRYVTLRQLATYDLSHPLLAPEPKHFSLKVLMKMNWSLQRNGYDTLIIYPRATVHLANGIKVDSYDVVDVVYALQITHLNGKLDYAHIKQFWDARLSVYHDVDFG